MPESSDSVAGLRSLSGGRRNRCSRKRLRHLRRVARDARRNCDLHDTHNENYPALDSAKYLSGGFGAGLSTCFGRGFLIDGAVLMQESGVDLVHDLSPFRCVAERMFRLRTSHCGRLKMVWRLLEDFVQIAQYCFLLNQPSSADAGLDTSGLDLRRLHHRS